MSDSEYGDLIAELQVEYLASFPDKFKKIDDLFTSEKWYELELEFHKLKGTGKTYGIPEVSVVCKEMERICRKEIHAIPSALPLCVEILQEIQTAYGQKIPLGFEISTDKRYVTLMNIGTAS